MERPDLLALAGIVMLSLTACVKTHTPIKQVEERAPSQVAAASGAVRVRLVPVSINVSFGEQIGEDGQGPGCLVHPGNALIWGARMERPVVQALNGVLVGEVRKVNYAYVVGAHTERADNNRPAAASTSSNDGPELSIAGQVTKMTLNTCYPGSVDPLVNLARGGKGDAYGSAYIRTEWTIASSADPARVYRVTTEGSAAIDEPAPGNVRILSAAFAVALRNLLAAPEFRTLVAGNSVPPVHPRAEGSLPSAERKSEPVSRAAVPPPGPSKSAPAGVGGLRVGDRWEYSFVDSRNGRSGSRKFEIEQATTNAIVERFELDDGKTLTAVHHDGAYLNMLGGMQFAPYYFAFQRAAATSPVDKLRVEGGDACGGAPVTLYNTYDCEVSAKFEGSETVTVPGGTFQSQRVRVKVYRQVWGNPAAGNISGVLAYGQFWISLKAGRIVKAVIKYETDSPWTETMELVSYRARGQPGATAR